MRYRPEREGTKGSWGEIFRDGLGLYSALVIGRIAMHATQMLVIAIPFVARISSRAKSAPRVDIHVRRTYSGRRNSSMWFSEATAMATSVVCRIFGPRARASPITRL